MNAGTSCSKHPTGSVAAVEGVGTPEKSSRQFGVPSIGSPLPAGTCRFVRGFRRFFVSEWYPSRWRRVACTFLSLRRDDSGPLRIHRQYSPLGFWQVAGHLRGDVFSGGAGTGQGPI